MKIGSGIFMWDGDERRSRRYGSFYPSPQNFGGDAHVPAWLDDEALSGLDGRRVRVTCIVTETRDSGHAGDAFLGIKPSRPEVGEVVGLGVGTLHRDRNHDGNTAVVLQPLDRRLELWIDPRKLYRLHDQTVEIYAEITDAPGSPRADLKFAEVGVIANGDGTLQYSGVEPEEDDRLLPTSERIGDGLFALHPPTAGQRACVVDRRGRRK